MFSKKGLIATLLVIAVILSVFSLLQTLYSNSQSGDSEGDSGGNGGNLQLGVLPPAEAAPTLNTESPQTP